MWNRHPGGIWAADNGRFSNPEAYTDDGYLAWLARRPAETCLFATAPDVVQNAAATLALSRPMFARIRALGYRVAFVAQDGLEDLEVPWDEFDALFIGGSTTWKMSEAAAVLALEARRRRKWVHMGRVNSRRRLAYSEAIGCHSADGTHLKYEPGAQANVEAWVAHVLANPSLWGGVE